MTRTTLLFWMIITAAVVLVYGGTLDHSFHFDDILYITDNPTISRVGDLQSIWRANIGSPARFVAFYTFALQRHIHGNEPFGFHVVNILIHMVNGLLVFWLARSALMAAHAPDDTDGRTSSVIALFAALVFVAHPIQTQAVTYIVQRFASLATMFYILSVVLYIKGRTAGNNPGWFAGSAVAALLGMFTKQIVLTLPLMIVLTEAMILRKSAPSSRRAGLWILCAILLAFIAVIPLMYSFDVRGILSQQFPSRSHLEDTLDSRTYLLTQSRVVATYIRLLFIPLGQNLDYDFHASSSFFEWPVWVCFLLLTAILLTAYKIRKTHPLMAFGVFWFFLAMLVESSIIPIPQVIFEHRCYLPSVGFVLFLSTALFRAFRDFRKYCAALALIVVTLGYMAYERNKVWENEVTLWLDAARKSPGKIRPYLNLAIGYVTEREHEKAIEQFARALSINPTSIRALNNRGIAYKRMGRLDEALADFNAAIELDPRQDPEHDGGMDVNWSEVFINRAQIYRDRKEYNKALKDLDRAALIDPRNSRVYHEMGFIHEALGRFDRALANYDKALSLDPDHVDSLLGIGVIHYYQKQYALAVENFDRAAVVAPELAVTYFYRALAHDALGNPAQAKNDMERAVRMGYKVDNPLLLKMQRRILGLKKGGS